ncbi:MAG: hypothetical protein AAGD40_06905 [Pseudomonadota bacterium]
MMTEAAPMRFWYHFEYRDKYGQPPMRATPPGVPVGDDGSYMYSASATRIGSDAMRALRAANIIVDMSQTRGSPLDAIARYAAFMGFAQMKPEEGSHPKSILGLFDAPWDDADPVLFWSDMDVKFMRGLYDMPMARTARQQKRMLANSMMDGEGG